MMHRYRLKESIVPSRQSINGIVLTNEWKYFKEKVDKLGSFINNIIDYELVDEAVEFQKKLEEKKAEEEKILQIQQNEQLAKDREPSLLEKVFSSDKEFEDEDETLGSIDLVPKTKQDYVNMTKKELIDLIVESNPSIYSYSDFKKQDHPELVLTVWHIKGLQ